MNHKTDNMKDILINQKILYFAMTIGFIACNNKKENVQQKEDEPTQEVRSLAVSIDESALTYEDLTIHLSNGTDYKYQQVPFGTVKVSIDDLPVSVAELQNLQLPKGMTSIHQSPYLQPLLIMSALNMLNEDKDEARRMIDFIVKGVKSENRDGMLVHFPGDGATTAYPSDWSQANQYKSFTKVRSYLEGAKNANSYTPEEKPYVMTMTITDHSYTADKDCFQLWLTSTQASSMHPISIWEYDSDGDGAFDTYWSSTYLPLLHGLAEY